MGAMARTGDAAVMPRRGAVDNATFGMGLFVFTEAMLFAGFISAFGIVRDNALPGAWPPAGQPRLPLERTALNTLALIASGVLLWVAGRRYRAAGAKAAQGWLGAAVLLGATFVIAQGAEWAALLAQGLTLRSSQLGSFFYTIVGGHALHAVAALILMVSAWLGMRDGTLRDSRFSAARVFWYFVVLVWPVLYWRVYR